MHMTQKTSTVLLLIFISQESSTAELIENVCKPVPIEWRINGPEEAALSFGASAAMLQRGGKPTLAVGQPNHELCGGVWLFSLDNKSSEVEFEDLKVLKNTQTPSPIRGEGFGASITSLGDLNGDGDDELAIGAPGSSAVCHGCGVVYLASTLSGELQAILINGERSKVGIAVAVWDRLLVIASETMLDFVHVTINGEGTIEYHHAFSSGIQQFLPSRGAKIVSLELGGDWDANGVDELIVGVVHNGISRVWLASIGCGRIEKMTMLSVGGVEEGLGYAAVGLSDLTGDNVPEVILSGVSQTYIAAGRPLQQAGNGTLTLSDWRSFHLPSVRSVAMLGKYFCFGLQGFVHMIPLTCSPVTLKPVTETYQDYCALLPFNVEQSNCTVDEQSYYAV